MADPRSYGLSPSLDIQQLQLEARHRWLRPAEICEILRNYQTFHISSEPPNRPPSGSLYIFDKKVLRYFRKDGHNWRKKNDGKTVKEAHEKLKVGSVDVLHCYYAHGEGNANFQRRSYWMLEENLMHIVFVHYLEVQPCAYCLDMIGNRDTLLIWQSILQFYRGCYSFESGLGITDNKSNLCMYPSDPTHSYLSDLATTKEINFKFDLNHNKKARTAEPGNRTNGSHSDVSFPQGHSQEPSRNTISTSPTSTLSSAYEDADSEDIHQASSRYHPSPSSPQMQKGNMISGLEVDLKQASYQHAGSANMDGPTNNDGRSGTHIMSSQDLASWEDIWEQCSDTTSNLPPQVTMFPNQPAAMGTIREGEFSAGGTTIRSLPGESNWQIRAESSSIQFPAHTINPPSNLELGFDLDTAFFEQRHYQNVLDPVYHGTIQDKVQALQRQRTVTDAEHTTNANNDKIEFDLIMKQLLLDGEENLKKVDSFARWADEELVEVDNLQMHASSGISWSTDECGNVVDNSSLGPSLSQDQLFSIIDFSPKWTYTDLEPEVIITGTFLGSREVVGKQKWSCMFGEVEIPAEVIEDGILCCRAPPHIDGRVPFYVTCSNRFACSEVREFHYHLHSAKDADATKYCYKGSTDEMLLHLRLERLLSLRSSNPPNNLLGDAKEKQHLIGKVMLLRDEDDSCQKKDLFEELMKDKLYSWIYHKVIEGGKGPSVLDDDGQGVLHLAAALGYAWAIKPTVAAGVSINFRDVNGWTALHWAAYCGREQMVAVLVSLDAAPGFVTDPTPELHLGRTPADLASDNGHKGISGFLAESTLTSYVTALSITESKAKDQVCQEVSGTKAVQTFANRSIAPVNCGDLVPPDVLSLKDSLSAVCNATLAANRIHQAFRIQSFQRKQLTELDDVTDELAVSALAAKSRKGVVHAAATHIQKKYRGWKKRKEFLIMRQRIVKIQAHVRGHQLRKQYKAITWSVGVLEKVILRWRRKGSGLRGFRRDAISDVQNCLPSKEDDYDFLKEGRKQTEERFEKALTRVKSMVQYPEGRAQYRRLLTVVEGFRDSKVVDTTMASSEAIADEDEELIDIDLLLENDTFMSIGS